jgi:Rha family phage regulatory protein
MNQLEQKLTSLEVAEMVEKDHSKLLRDIRTYSEQINEAKIGLDDFFTESTYVDAKGETRPCFNVTKKGCELIANKLTGLKGTIFTAKYVNKFHDMEDALKLPTTYKEALQQLLSQVEENEKLIEQKSELEESVKKMDKVICDMTPKADYVDRILSSTDCMTVTQIAQDYGMSAKRFNQILANACIQRHVCGQWILYADHQGKGYVRNKTCEYKKSNGTGTNLLTVWTQKGRMFLYDRLKAIGIEPVVA